MLSRRDVLRAAAAAATSTVLLRPGVAAVFRSGARDDADDRRTLVLVELTGGNDGLNTIVPYADDRYHALRPSLRRPSNAVQKIDDSLGYAPELSRLFALHRDGLARVELGVGMERPDRSHFESLDRWHTGDGAPGGRAEGWLGRALFGRSPGRSDFPAVALGDRTPPRLFLGAGSPSLAAQNLAELAPSAATARALLSEAFEALQATRGSADDRALERAARELSERLDSVRSMNVASAEIAETDLGLKLADATRLLRGGLSTRAIFVRTGGFDTHARQDGTHPALLSGIDAALAPFVSTLRKDGRLGDVLTIVYSEFGRRVAENGSRGTDHGSANPVLLFGGGLKAGVFGERPDLRNLDDGDVRATTDFRRILATALRHLGVEDSKPIFGARIEPL
jgi:uncharacterized protein (DUF1501 family)